MKILADGDKFFEPKILEQAYRQPPESTTTVIHLPPKTFLELAKGLFSPSEKKLGRTQELFHKGVKFNEVPYFRCEVMDNGDLLVVAHEGRHRAMNLRDAGVKLMPLKIIVEHQTNPVRLSRTRPYRWGLTTSRPKRIHGQTKSVFKFPQAETYSVPQK